MLELAGAAGLARAPAAEVVAVVRSPRPAAAAGKFERRADVRSAVLIGNVINVTFLGAVYCTVIAMK